jgi:hypothetical protein
VGFTDEERETIVTADDLDTSWRVYTRQRKIITKLQKLGYQPLKTKFEDGRIIEATFELPSRGVFFRCQQIKKRVVSDAERQKRSARCKTLQAKRKQKAQEGLKHEPIIKFDDLGIKK